MSARYITSVEITPSSVRAVALIPYVTGDDLPAFACDVSDRASLDANTRQTCTSQGGWGLGRKLGESLG